MVEQFAKQAIEARYKITNEMMVNMLREICNRRECRRFELISVQDLVTPITLRVEGVGELKVAPNQEPADMVEQFAKQAIEARYKITNEMMVNMLRELCNRRECRRFELISVQDLATPITLRVEGVGELTVAPNQEPADMIENFAKQAIE